MIFDFDSSLPEPIRNFFVFFICAIIFSASIPMLFNLKNQ